MNQQVPAVFRDLEGFLGRVRKVAAARPGGLGELAARCCVRESTLAKWFYGQARPSRARLEKMKAWWMEAEADWDELKFGSLVS